MRIRNTPPKETRPPTVRAKITQRLASIQTIKEQSGVTT